MKKVTIVGAGQVGGTTAFLLGLWGIADVTLIDIAEGLARGKGMDLAQAGILLNLPVSISGTTDYGQMKGSDLVVVTAGLARKPGMTRADLALKNAQIVSQVALEIKQRAPGAIVIVVTNPVDCMTYLTMRKTGFPSSRVIGQGGILDVSRLRYYLSEQAGVQPGETEGLVIGPHSQDMIIPSQHSRVQGKALDRLFSASDLESIKQETRQGGKAIVELLKTGSAYYAPGTAVSIMVRAILNDTGEIFPCSVYLEGQYGLKDIYLGAPARLGREGLAEIVELPLGDGEMKELRQAEGKFRETMSQLAKAGVLEK